MFSLIQTLAAEWIALGQAPKLIQKIVRIDIVSPGLCEWG